MKIKKQNKNEYLLTTDGFWVRNFCKRSVPYVDINDLTIGDQQLMLENELANHASKMTYVFARDLVHPNVVIVSDGYDFEERQEILADLPKEVTIIGTNRALAKWRLLKDSAKKKAMNFYVVNNPYAECMKFLPKTHRYFPRCIASKRTNAAFLNAYEGEKYLYVPVPDKNYSGPGIEVGYKIDDYRNPICAAIGLAFNFGVEKLMLFCCDSSFKDERPSAVRLPNGLWTYPQQLISQRLIEANLYWLKASGVEVADASSGLKYESATYIQEQDVLEYFRKKQNV